MSSSGRCWTTAAEVAAVASAVRLLPLALWTGVRSTVRRPSNAAPKRPRDLDTTLMAWMVAVVSSFFPDDLALQERSRALHTRR